MKPYYTDSTVTLYHGKNLAVLPHLADGSVDCVVTSPPYFGLRSYLPEDHPDKADEYGAEETPAEFVANLVATFREVRRVLADDGVVWLNLGDSYSQSQTAQARQRVSQSRKLNPDVGPKNLLGIPWRTAFALQDDGWILRNAAVWHAPNKMPESVTDRLSTRYEMLFLFSKSRRYWFDLDPIREAHSVAVAGTSANVGAWAEGQSRGIPATGKSHLFGHENGRNPGDVWNIPTVPFSSAHFATYPPELVRRCIVSGCKPRVCQTCGHAPTQIVEKGDLVPSRPGATNTTTQAQPGHVGTAAGERDFSGGGHALPRRERTVTGWTDCGHNDYRAGTVLDPFHGSGTTGMVAVRNGRKYVGIELNQEYLDLSLRTRLADGVLDFEGGEHDSLPAC